MVEPPKGPLRHPGSDGEHDVIEYVFTVHIEVRPTLLDERRVREIVGEEVRKLHLAVESRGG